MKFFTASLLFLSGTALALPTGLETTTLEKRTAYTTGATANDVTNGVCAPLTVIFARGTSESGNIGSVVGPPLFKALISALGSSKVALQGVTYPASAAGNANQGGDGGPTMKSLAQQALANCPTTKIVLSGYSQGAMVVHNALNKQGLSSSSVSAIVEFGDPLIGISAFGSVPSSKVKQYCATGDAVCQNHSGVISSAHLSYGSDATDAANFIISATGVTK